MKKTLVSFCALLFLCVSAVAQNTNPSTTAQAEKSNANTNAAAKRGPVFRATKEQIKRAQTLLKGRGFYAGEETGKLDDPTRAGLRKFQEAEGVRVTGTLNAATLDKMNITLTDRQREIRKAQEAAAKPVNANPR